MRFSVIIPVYNVAEYLQPCVESVLRNDCTDCEILLVDDGSTDGVCPQLCDALARQHPGLLRVIHQENAGLGGARNTGLETARGEYVLFLDSDDTLEPEALSVFSDILDRYDPEVLAFRLIRDDGQGSLVPIPTNVFSAETPFSLAQRPEFLLSLPSAACRLWKRELFTRTGIRFPSRVWYEDIRTTTKLLASARSIFALDRCLYRYFCRPGSIMNSRQLERNREILEAFTDILDWFSAQGLLEQYRQELERLAIDHILLAATVRVARQDPKHPLLADFVRYVDAHFPDWEQNPYLPRLSRLHKLLLRLIRGKHYRIISLLFRLKDGSV